MAHEQGLGDKYDCTGTGNMVPKAKKKKICLINRISVWTHFCRTALHAEPNFWLFFFFFFSCQEKNWKIGHEPGQIKRKKKKSAKNTIKKEFPHFALLIFYTHTPLLVKRVNWGYLYTPIQTGTFECGYTPAYWGYTKYKCDYTPITWGYPNIPSIGDMLLNAFIWHFRSHAGNAQMGTSPVGSVSTFPLAESDVCPRFTRFTNAPPHTQKHST